MIIYFTGTGNSKHIAQIMAKKLNDSIVDAAELMMKKDHPEFISDKPYIFVAPVYAWRMPRVFREWIRKCKFDGNKKVYFTLTCGGEIGAAGIYIEEFAIKMNFEYMGTAQVVMPDNYIIMFKPTTEEEDAEIISKAEIHTLSLCDRIQSGKAFDTIPIKLIGKIESGIINDSFYKYYINAKKFYSTDACISCGKCVESCMLNNIKLDNGRPVWGGDCTHCMSCIGKCPVAAIEYEKKTKGKRRYICKADQ